MGSTTVDQMKVATLEADGSISIVATDSGDTSEARTAAAPLPAAGIGRLAARSHDGTFV